MRITLCSTSTDQSDCLHLTVFSLVQYDKNCSEFSGGWQMRIALAKLLLGPAGQAAVGAGTGGLMML